MADISTNINNNQEHSASAENMANIVEWIEDNNKCCGGTCPVYHSDEEDEDGDVIMTDQAPQETPVEQSPPEIDDADEEEEAESDEESEEEWECECGKCDQQNNDDEESEGECQCGQSESEADETDTTMYVVTKDGVPISVHRSEESANAHMNTNVTSAVIDFLSSYTVHTSKEADGSIVISGSHKYTIMRWDKTLCTFRVLPVPIVN